VVVADCHTTFIKGHDDDDDKSQSVFIGPPSPKCATAEHLDYRPQTGARGMRLSFNLINNKHDVASTKLVNV